MAEENYNKFSDSRLFFSFLFKSQKTGVLTVSEVDEIKRDFISQKYEIMSLFQESHLGNDHDSFISRLRNYLSAKNKERNFSPQIIKLEEKKDTSEIFSNQNLKKFNECPYQHSSIEILGSFSNEKESFICLSQEHMLKSLQTPPRKLKKCHTQTFAGRFVTFTLLTCLNR